MLLDPETAGETLRPMMHWGLSSQRSLYTPCRYIPLSLSLTFFPVWGHFHLMFGVCWRPCPVLSRPQAVEAPHQPSWVCLFCGCRAVKRGIFLSIITCLPLMFFKENRLKLKIKCHPMLENFIGVGILNKGWIEMTVYSSWNKQNIIGVYQIIPCSKRTAFNMSISSKKCWYWLLLWIGAVSIKGINFWLEHCSQGLSFPHSHLFII